MLSNSGSPAKTSRTPANNPSARKAVLNEITFRLSCLDYAIGEGRLIYCVRKFLALHRESVKAVVDCSVFPANMADLIPRVKLHCGHVGIYFKFYPCNIAHGFGLGENTAAEGWLNNAVKFWEAHQ